MTSKHGKPARPESRSTDSPRKMTVSNTVEIKPVILETQRETEREYNKVQACFVLETLLQIFALEGFAKACPVGLTDSYNEKEPCFLCVCVWCVCCVLCVKQHGNMRKSDPPKKSRLVIEREGVGCGWVGVNAGCIGCNPSLRYATQKNAHGY